MWTSTAASGFGDRMIMLASLALLGGFVAGTSNSTSVQASTQFWFFLPYVLFSVPAGWVADRLPRKWLLLTCDESRAAILLLSFFMLAIATGHAAIPAAYHWRVWAVLFAIGIFAATFNTTRNAFIPQIVRGDQLQPGNAIIMGINIVAAMIGMLLGNAIIDPKHAQSIRLGLLVAAGFYAVSGTFFIFMRIARHARPGDAAQRHTRSLTVASRYVRVHGRIMVLIALSVLVWIIAAIVTTAIIGLGKQLYGYQGHALEGYFAWTYAFVGGGFLVGAIAIGAIGTRRESLAVTFLAMIGAGVCILLLSGTPVLALGYLFALGIGFFGNIVIVSIMTLLQSMAPNYIRGRVMGLNAVAANVLSVGAYLAIWRLPDADVNIMYVLYTVGPMLIIIGGVALIRYLTTGKHPAFTNLLWRIDRLYVLVWHRLKWIGRHHIPNSGPVILASNHTTGLDPALIQAACPRVIHWVMMRAYQFRVLGPVWRAIEPIGLDFGQGDRAKIRAVIEALKAGSVVGLFPEGGVQRTHRELQPFQLGLAMIAKRSGATIVPVWIAGTPRRKNMLWHFLQPSRCRIAFGKPYRVDPDAAHEQIMEDLRQRMLQLAAANHLAGSLAG